MDVVVALDGPFLPYLQPIASQFEAQCKKYQASPGAWLVGSSIRRMKAANLQRISKPKAET